MNRKISAIILFILIGWHLSIAQIYGIRQSQKATVGQQIGVTDITISYSRPAVKERNIWGSLVKMDGSTVWRAGANENTTISFTHDVLIEGQKLAAGTYGLYMIPADDKWIIIFSSDTQAWGSFKYEAKNDILRIKVSSQVNNQHQELLAYEFSDLTIKTGIIHMKWEKKDIPIKIEIDNFDTVVLNHYKSLMKSPAGWDYFIWGEAAYVCINNQIKIDGNELLGWAKKAYQIEKRWDTRSSLIDVYKYLNKEEEAKAMEQERIEMASNVDRNRYGYFLLDQGKHKEAMEVFELNTKKHPDDPNVWSSLAEGYMTIGDDKKAIKYLKKTLSMNPVPYIKDYSEELLKQLEAKNNK